MTRLFAAAAFVIAFACSGAFASQPGQPLDCSDVVFMQPGYSCSDYIPYPCDQSCSTPGSNLVIDNQQRLIVKKKLEFTSPDCSGSLDYDLTFDLYEDSHWIVLARLSKRCYDLSSDDAQISGLLFDGNRGRLLAPLLLYCTGPGCSYPNDGGRMIAISGFATSFDVLQTYTPQPAAFGFRVPYMPEGMAGADSFDTYWGTLTKPIDFTQAHSLACDYPAAAPHVGDYLTVADTVPTPAPGQGIYYVTSATYQGATRYGRKTTAGHLSGRDPAVLPVCGP